MFQKLHKPKGYPFASVELGRVVTTEGKDRVVAQVDSTEAIKFVQEVALKYKISDEEESRLIAIAQNCHGMIHIFSPEQVEEIADVDFGTEHHDECDHDPDYIVQVILNGRDESFRVHKGNQILTYGQIVERAGYKESDVVTVVWDHSKSGSGGSIVEGQFVEHKTGMVINAVVTGSA